MSITTIIFSKNRACQLDALLLSIDKFARSSLDIHIIYTYSDSRYKNGYDKLIEYYRDADISWLIEDDFQQQVISILQNNDSKCSSFLTDDSIYFKNLKFTDDSLGEFFEGMNCYTFSPRCGFNTRQQCHWEPIFQQNLQPEHIIEDIVVWDFTKQNPNYDYGRPVSLDGNINSKKLILSALLSTKFSWCGELDNIDKSLFNSYMASYEHSILTNVPVNSTHGHAATNWGKFYTHTFEDLNRLFLEGKRINIDKLDFSNVYGGHQEFEYTLE